MTVTVTRNKTTRTDTCTECGGEYEVTALGMLRRHGPRGAKCRGSGRFAPSVVRGWEARRARKIAAVLEILRPHTAIAATLAPDIIDALDKLAREEG